tara:strand:+ start:329 stop:958 length:630 start_codon:yes stop_codon:yes gene_type:complete
MKVLESKYNNFSDIDDVVSILNELDPYFKESDQNKKISTVIFDPKGTNQVIKEKLLPDWTPNLPIPKEHKHLGKDVDFYKDGSIIEVQFSNYPFLANNLLRSEVFYKSNALVFPHKVRSLTIITKGAFFPSSNSTLYYEQAKSHLDSWYVNNIFTIPVRLLGLTIDESSFEDGVWTVYGNRRYARDFLSRKIEKFSINERGKIVFSNKS